MKTLEKEAFIKAYSNNVGDVSAERVIDFLCRYETGEDIHYGEGHTSIMDALGIWHEAINFFLSSKV